MIEIKPYTFLVYTNRTKGIRCMVLELVSDKERVKQDWENGTVRRGTFEEYMNEYTNLTQFLIETSDGIYVREEFKNIVMRGKKKDKYRKVFDSEIFTVPLIEVFDTKMVERQSDGIHQLSMDVMFTYLEKNYEIKMFYNTEHSKWSCAAPMPLFEEECPMCKRKKCGYRENGSTFCLFFAMPQIRGKIMKQLLKNEMVMNRWQSDENPYRIKMALCNAFDNPKLW